MVSYRPTGVAAGQADGIQPRTIEVLQVCKTVLPQRPTDNPILSSELWPCGTSAARELSDAYGGTHARDTAAVNRR